MNFDEVALEEGLNGDDALNQERVGVLHVKMHEGHHGDTHKLAAESLTKLRGIVGLDGGGDQLALLRGSHGRRLDVLKRGHI